MKRFRPLCSSHEHRVLLRCAFVSLVCRTYGACPALAILHTAGAVGYLREVPATLELIVRAAPLARHLIAGVILAKKASLLY